MTQDQRLDKQDWLPEFTDNLCALPPHLEEIRRIWNTKKIPTNFYYMGKRVLSAPIDALADQIYERRFEAQYYACEDWGT